MSVLAIMGAIEVEDEKPRPVKNHLSLGSARARLAPLMCLKGFAALIMLHSQRSH
jgi:hypothetical protein